MNCFFGIDSVPSTLAPSIITWGVFDGMHFGHQRVISRVVSWARQQGISSLVLTFHQHPGLTLNGKVPPLVTSLDHKLVLIERMDVDTVVVAEFDQQLADMRAVDFVTNIIFTRLKAKGVVRGSSTRFGRAGEGGLVLLRRLGRELGFRVEVIPACKVAGKSVSSTAIRHAISAGNLEQASDLLGRPLSRLGTVVNGLGRGAKLGFPTANLDLGKAVMPGAGVYFCKVMVAGTWRPALASIGTRPTFDVDELDSVLEVFILDFKGNLRGQSLEVQFLKRMRDQVAYASRTDLVAQMNRDVREAREFFGLLDG